MDLAECKGIYVIAEQFEGKLRDVSLNCWVRPASWLTPLATKSALFLLVKM